MISRSPGLLLVIYLACLEVSPRQTASFASEPVSSSLARSSELHEAQKLFAASVLPIEVTTRLVQAVIYKSSQSLLAIANQEAQVAERQKTFKLLGYFDDEGVGIDEASPAEVGSKFQKAASLSGATLVQDTSTSAEQSDSPFQKTAQSRAWLLPSLVGGALLAGGLGVLALRRRFSEEESEEPGLDPSLQQARSSAQQPLPGETSEAATSSAEISDSASDSAAVKEKSSVNGYKTLTVSETSPHKESTDPRIGYVTEPPQVAETTRLAKINIVDELVRDLRTSDPVKRQKVIWELSQRGDTRAVQPMVDLMLDSDSKQRSLILSALSEIGTRTLKPLSRTLAISLQDESADVRKNAIRDLTRVYDLVAQISHLLHQAADDPDQEVQETARWALGQLNRIRTAPETENLPALKKSVNPPEGLP